MLRVNARTETNNYRLRRIMTVKGKLNVNLDKNEQSIPEA